MRRRILRGREPSLLAAVALAFAAASCTSERGPSVAEIEAIAQSGGSLARLDLRDRDLDGIRLGATDLSGADLRGSSLRGADLGGATLAATLFVESDLSSANLEEASLTGAMLQAANLEGARLGGADLTHANLERADLSGADLSEARLVGAYLWRARLSGADVTGANVAGADFRSANLGAADLSAVRNLTAEQLEHACGNGRLRLPPGIPPPPPCRAGAAPRPAASPTEPPPSVVGRVHCGELERCTPERFLVFTKFGGKIIQVTEANDAAQALLRERLQEGARVEIHGVEVSDIPRHRYFVPAARIDFPD